MRERKNLYPTAEEFGGTPKYPIKTDEEILEKMKDAKKKKRKWAFFRGARISKVSYKQLVKKGFKVDVYEDKWNVPCFHISWYEKM